MKNKAIKLAGYIITIIALIFILNTFKSMNFDVKYIKNPVSAVLLVIALAIGYAIMVYISSYAWKSILEFIHKDKIPLQEIITVYVRSNIGKYLPGNVMHFAGRNILAGKLGFKQLDITFCSIIEIIMLIFTDCVLSAIFALKNFRTVIKTVFSRIDLNVIYGVSIALVSIIILAVIIIKKSSIMDRYKHFFTIDFLKLVCKLFCIYGLTLVIPGVFLVVILKVALGCSITWQIILITISASTISWVIGFIVPGAPGGIGVRESILLLILGAIYTNNIILLASILLRVASILGDVLAFFMEPILRHNQNNNKPVC